MPGVYMRYCSNPGSEFAIWRVFYPNAPKTHAKAWTPNSLSHILLQIVECFLRGLLGGGFIGVEFDRDPARVCNVANGPEDFGPIHGAFAGDAMLVDAVFLDVFEVDMGDVGGAGPHDLGRVFLHAVEMTEVAVHLEMGMIDPLKEFDTLVGVLDDETGLGLDHQGDAELLGQREDFAEAGFIAGKGLLTRQMILWARGLE